MCPNEKEAGQVHCGGTDQKHQRYVPPKAKKKKSSAEKSKGEEKLGCKWRPPSCITATTTARLASSS